MRFSAIKGLAFTIGTGLAVLTATLPVQAADYGGEGKVNLNFGSGRQGGSQYPVTVAIAQVLEKLPQIGKISIQPGGSIGNIVRVNRGTSDIAISMSQSLNDGRRGEKPFPKKTTNVVELFTLHPFNVAVVVPADSPVKSMKDFAGRKLNLAPKGFSITEIGMHILDKLGLKGKVDVGYLRIQGALDSFKDGHIAGILYAPSNRYGPLMNLAETHKIRLIQIDKGVLEDMIKENPSFFLTTFPKAKDAYPGLVNQVQTLGYPNVIVTSKSMPDELAYAIVKAVAENFDQVRIGDPSLKDFDPKDMARKVGAPFHPGAIKYYKERGWM